VKQFVAFVACSVALLACAQQQQQGYWLKPGASQEEFSADFLACTEQSKHPSSHASVDQNGETDSIGACMNAQGWYLASVTDSKGYSGALSAITSEQVELCSRADLQPIFAKMPCRPKDATPEQLSNRSKISKDEKTPFMKWRVLLEENNKKATAINRQYNRQTGDAMDSLIKRSEEANDRLSTRLYDGRIPWGEYNKGRIEIALQAEHKKQKLWFIEINIYSPSSACFVSAAPGTRGSQVQILPLRLAFLAADGRREQYGDETQVEGRRYIDS